MGLQRLDITRVDGKVYAVCRTSKSDGYLLEVTNPNEVPAGVEDGIFTTDPSKKTAQYESRHKAPGFVKVIRKNFDDTPDPRYLGLINETQCIQLLDGKVVVTLTLGEVIVDGEGFSKEIQKFIGALFQEDVSPEKINRALRYILEE